MLLSGLRHHGVTNLTGGEVAGHLGVPSCSWMLPKRKQFWENKCQEERECGGLSVNCSPCALVMSSQSGLFLSRTEQVREAPELGVMRGRWGS